MARERVYRHDVRCRRCGSNWMPKDGYARAASSQVRRLQEKYTADAEQPHFPEHVKRQAVHMCVEGASISAVARVVRASAPSVSGWLKKWTIARERMRGKLNRLTRSTKGYAKSVDIPSEYACFGLLCQVQTQYYSTLRISPAASS